MWYYLRYLHGKDQVNGATGLFSIDYATGGLADPVVSVMQLADGQGPAPG